MVITITFCFIALLAAICSCLLGRPAQAFLVDKGPTAADEHAAEMERLKFEIEAAKMLAEMPVRPPSQPGPSRSALRPLNSPLEKL